MFTRNNIMMGVVVILFIWAVCYLPPIAYHIGLCGNLLHKDEIDECVLPMSDDLPRHSKANTIHDNWGGTAVMVSGMTAMTGNYTTYVH